MLEELRRTEIVVDGQRRRLIDEVEVITGVSGGSFTALSYALYGDRLFAEYEERFLKRDVQGALIARGFNPFKWWKFVGGSAGRSELAAEYYDEILFEGATFSDLWEKPGPVALATGTDLSSGARSAFFQNDFDLLCSDLSKVRLSHAAATSSAVPVVLSPVTLNNYGGSCAYQYPAWADDVANPDSRARPSARAVQRYREMESLQNSKDRPFIHLVDGGVSDNIGVRGVLEFLEEQAASAAFRGELGFGRIRRIILLVVNSLSSPSSDWDRSEEPPGIVAQLLQSTSVPIDHYSFETIETMKDRAAIMGWQRELHVARARLAGATFAEAEGGMPKLSLEVIDGSFSAIRGPEEKRYFMNLPTSFVLPPDDIDRLRDVAARLMRQSSEYESAVRDVGGTPRK
ncbi:MAG: Patatin-like phospholipase [Candidatus Accumulibacter appositus]|uniref:Patatin-like phospholipase n=1 Tax=Candidatus Accumulibacter appositus TaxID=1454003 RepID=A0A011PSE4_9PROT|nr:patatin-like phospholipase family protein [Accumulibacter sp.]EXI79907.1 MAG: Patatin-like phospholipase [Candidatus Accumulibacter appositus]HRF05469.1 patatin-like phospholipase family protein [Accumulibacter sp.]